MSFILKKLDLSDYKFSLYNDEVSYWSSVFGVELLKKISIKRNSKVLDIGCGTGFPVIELAQRFTKDSNFWGVDFSNSMIEICKSKKEIKNLNNLEFMVSNAANLPFESNNFDLIISNLGFSGSEDRDSIIKEASRVLKPNGQIIFTAMTPGFLKEFYMIYQNVLNSIGLKEEILKLHEENEYKRKDLNYFYETFKNNSVDIIYNSEHSETLEFGDSESFLSYPAIKLYMLNSWENVINKLSDGLKAKVINDVKKRINLEVRKKGSFKVTLKFILIMGNKNT